MRQARHSWAGVAGGGNVTVVVSMTAVVPVTGVGSVTVTAGVADVWVTSIVV